MSHPIEVLANAAVDVIERGPFGPTGVGYVVAIVDASGEPSCVLSNIDRRDIPGFLRDVLAITSRPPTSVGKP